MLQPIVLETIHMAHLGPILQPLAMIPHCSVLQCWYQRVLLFLLTLTLAHPGPMLQPATLIPHCHVPKPHNADY